MVFQSEVFNDTILEMYMALTIYFLASKRLLWATIFMAIALAFKAGGLLALPAFLGILYLQKGPFKLLLYLALLIGLQFLIASPFIYTPVAQLLGFKAANTPLEDYVRRMLG